MTLGKTNYCNLHNANNPIHCMYIFVLWIEKGLSYIWISLRFAGKQIFLLLQEKIW